jgi:hypothetical protein
VVVPRLCVPESAVLEHGAFGRRRCRHRERSEAIQGNVGCCDSWIAASRWRAPRDDDSVPTQRALGSKAAELNRPLLYGASIGFAKALDTLAPRR